MTMLLSGTESKDWNVVKSLILGKFRLGNAFGADALLAQLTLMPSVEENAKFSLCTKEANVALDNFGFEIGRQAIQFGT